MCTYVQTFGAVQAPLMHDGEQIAEKMKNKRVLIQMKKNDFIHVAQVDPE